MDEYSGRSAAEQERRCGLTIDRERNAFGSETARSLKLILLSQILEWMATGKLQFQLYNALSQIALAYFFAFLIVQLKFRSDRR